MPKSSKKSVSRTTLLRRTHHRPARSETKHPVVFLSYNSADRSLAIDLAHLLAAGGYRVSNDEDAIAAGANWLSAVGRALDRSDAVVFLLSPAALSSETTSLELRFVLGSKRFKNRVIPVLIDTEPGQVPWILRHLPFVSAGKAINADAGRIAEAVTKQLDQCV